jgi:GMP synthase-like glutamine amidotransferase
VRVHTLQHVPFEGLAALAPALRAAGHEIATTRLYAGERLPDPDAFDWLVVLGGPMSVNDESRFAWLGPEKRLIERSLASGRAVLGICLGAQLLAAALGARVVRNAEREIGWFPVERVAGAESSRYGRALPPRALAFHWHGETFDLPAGAVHLARSAACEHQAFAYGERALGLQFHLETTAETAAALIEHCDEDLTPGPYVQPAKAILGDPARFETLGRTFERLGAVLP